MVYSKNMSRKKSANSRIKKIIRNLRYSLKNPFTYAYFAILVIIVIATIMVFNIVPITLTVFVT